MKLPLKKLEKLKKAHKAAIFIGTIVILGAAFFFLVYQPSQAQIEAKNKEIQTLEDQIKTHKKKADKLEDARKDLMVVQLEFDASQRFLPQQKEVDNLLRQISDAGAQAGLNVLLFQPDLRDSPKDFYAEIGFDMKLEGPYLNVASFFYKISQMDRIVDISDFTLASPKMLDSEMILTTSCKGKTFRSLTPEEIEAQKKAREAAAKQQRKKQGAIGR